MRKLTNNLLNSSLYSCIVHDKNELALKLIDSGADLSWVKKKSSKILGEELTLIEIILLRKNLELFLNVIELNQRKKVIDNNNDLLNFVVKNLSEDTKEDLEMKIVLMYLIINELNNKNTKVSILYCLGSQKISDCIIELLIEHEINLEKRSMDDVVPLLKIIEDNKKNLFDLIITKNIDIFKIKKNNEYNFNYKDYYRKQDAISYATVIEDDYILKKLIKIYIDNGRYKEIEYALNVAVVKDNNNSFELLLEAVENPENLKIFDKDLLYDMIYYEFSQYRKISIERRLLKRTGRKVHESSENNRKIKKSLNIEMVNCLIKRYPKKNILENIDDDYIKFLIFENELFSLYGMLKFCELSIINNKLNISYKSENILISDNSINRVTEKEKINLLFVAIINNDVSLVKLLLQTKINFKIEDYLNRGIYEYLGMINNIELNKLIEDVYPCQSDFISKDDDNSFYSNLEEFERKRK